MSFKTRRLKISPELKDLLYRKDIKSCQDVLSKSSLELLRICDCSYSQIKSLQQICSDAVSPRISNALLMKQNSVNEKCATQNYMPTTFPVLDRILHGGLPLGTITEITGPSGCGKTQFCLMLSAIVVSSHFDEGVVFIDTEGAFSAQRLLEILQTKFPSLDDLNLENAMKKVHVIRTHTCSSLLKSVEAMEELIISQRIKIILIDSVTSLMRKEFSSASQSIIERTNLLTNIASILKYTAAFFKIPVVITNQITTQYRHHGPKIGNEEGGDNFENGGFDTKGQGGLIPALGNTWSHSVNTRLILQYLPGGTRQICVAKSPVAPFAAVSYRIQAEGPVELGNEASDYEGTDPGLQTITPKGQFPSTSAWS